MHIYDRVRAAALGLSGWRAGGVAFVLGAVMTSSLPPLAFWPGLLIAMTGAFWLVSGARTGWGAFGRGLAFGFGYFVVGLYWIGFAFLVEADRFAILAPFAVGGLSFYLALYPAVVFAVFHKVWGRSSTGGDAMGAVMFAALWVLGEWLRGWVLTGFPWNPLGEVFDGSEAMLQMASVMGVYGLSLLAVLIGVAPAVLATRAGRRFALIMLAVVGLVWGGGAARLAGAGDDVVPGVQLRLVQPNISQQDKWRPELRQDHVLKQVRLSAAPVATGAPPPNMVIWGETAVPFYLAADPARRAMTATALPQGALLITGAPRAVRIFDAPPGEPRVRVWNSSHVLNHTGEIIATYDKSHLVPFGEYVPLREVLSRIMDIKKITAGNVDFSAGAGVQTLDLPGVPGVSPLICYEVIFSGRVVAHDGPRPGWLLNLTNDSWYGRTAGPYQHLALSRMRAVEEGLPLVRVAGTGISAVVDGYGRITGALGLGAEGVLDRPLPQALAPTVFARLGHLPVLGLILGLMAAAVLRRRRDHINTFK